MQGKIHFLMAPALLCLGQEVKHMKEITIQMPEVKSCGVLQCGYNQTGSCHAKAITIGDTMTPECDTFFVSQAHAKNVSVIAGVGACKVSSCKFNTDFECVSESIQVGHTHDRVCCLTYKKR